MAVLYEVSAQACGQADGQRCGGPRKRYISADPESIPVCGVNLVSGPLAEISDQKVEQHSRPKSHYQIGPAQHFAPK